MSKLLQINTVFHCPLRNDDIIKIRGEKVNPVEIENIIYKIKGIKEVAVIGIPDELMGEAIAVFVIIHDVTHLLEFYFLITLCCISKRWLILQLSNSTLTSKKNDFYMRNNDGFSYIWINKRYEKLTLNIY